MQRRAVVGVTAPVWRIVLGVVLLAFIASTGRGIEVFPEPGPLVPEKMQRLFALNIHTGEIAYDQTVRGPLQQAALSDGERVAYAVVAPGSRLWYPRSDVFVQDFAAPVSTLLRQLYDDVNAVTVTDTRVAWATDDYFAVHSTIAATTLLYYADLVLDLRIKNDVVTFIDRDSYPSKVVSRDLVTGESNSHFQADLSLFRIFSARSFDAVHDSLVAVMLVPESSQLKVAKLSPNTPPEYLPIAAHNLATNGEQIVFASTNLANGSSVGLHLYDAGHIALLTPNQEFEGNDWFTSEFSISANSVAWASGASEDRRIWVHDLASGVARQLPTIGPGLRLWDLNDDYILLSSDVVAVPEPGSCMLLAVALAMFSGVNRGFGFRSRR